MLVAAGLAGGRDHALISLLALNGLRVSEALGADIEDLGLERGHRTLTILRKGGKVVTVPLAPRTARAIDLAVGERCDGPMFVGADGQRIDRHAAGRIVRRIARRAGIAKRVGPHTLRHAFITAALDAGVPLRDVQEAASHADPRTTMRYDRARVRSTGTPPTSWPPSSPAPAADTPVCPLWPARSRQSGQYACMSQWAGEPRTYLFRDRFEMADAMGQTRSEYVGQSRQDALNAAHDAGFETRVLDLPVTGDVLWRDDLRNDRLNVVVADGTVIRAAVF
jgi:Phage integrase family